MSLRLASCAAAVLLLATACASDPGEGRGPPPHTSPGEARGGPPGEGARRGCGPLFVSPAGEPFRGEPDSPVCPLRTWFARADSDGDGALSRAEFRNDALRFFAVLDVDGNGYVDGLELQAYEHRIVPEILGRGGGPSAALASKPRLLPAALQMGGGMGGGGMGGGGMGGGGGRRGRGGGDPPAEGGEGGHRGLEGGGGLARFGLLGEPEPVAASDLDLDGRITRVEFAARADQRFHSLDEAETGRLLPADLERRLRARGGRGPGPNSGRPSGGGGRGGHGGGGRRGGYDPPQA